MWVNESVLDLNDKRIGGFLTKENPNPHVSQPIAWHHKSNEEVIDSVAKEMIPAFPGLK